MRTATFQIVGSRSRRGSTYVMIMAVVVVLAVIGVSVLAVDRINTRTVTQVNDWAQAPMLAFSAAEYALAKVSSTGNWRAAYADSSNEVPYNRGMFVWEVVDPFDASLTDDSGDPIDVVTTGSLNDALHKLNLRCFVVGVPLEALNCPLHADGDVTVNTRDRLTVTGAAVSSNGELQVQRNATIDGDAQADTITIGRRGEITGDVSAPVPPKQSPPSYVFEMYKSLASRVRKSGTINKALLSPGNNPWGTRNANGVYYIDVGNQNLTIKNSRIHGTLVVRCRELRLEGAVLLHSYRKDYPVLVVDGNVRMSFRSKFYRLSEFLLDRNLNPPGTPYNAHADNDKLDMYPNEVQGLVHVKGAVEMKRSARVRGAAICEGRVTCRGDNEIIHVPSLYANPPLGYTTGGGRISPQMWIRVVE